MNKLAFLICLIFATGCSGSSGGDILITALNNSKHMIDLLMDQKSFSELMQGSEIPSSAELEALKKLGFAGYFCFSVYGSKKFDGPILYSISIQHPQTLEWITTPRVVVDLLEEQGTTFFYSTAFLTDGLDIRFRRHIDMRFPNGGLYSTEFTYGGAVFKITKKLQPDQITTLAFLFDESHRQDTKLTGSQWELITKQDIFDNFLNKQITKTTTTMLPRQKDDQLWLRVKQDEVSFYSALTLKDVNKKEKPDLILSNIISIEIKRLDPKKGE